MFINYMLVPHIEVLSSLRIDVKVKGAWSIYAFSLSIGSKSMMYSYFYIVA